MTLPVVAPLGTGTVILVPLHPVGVPAVPLNVTMLVPCVAPKFIPAIITEVPTAPDIWLTLVMLGGAVTVKFTPLLATPPTVTMTLPVVAPLGTGTVILVPLHPVGVPAVPLNVTVLVPCVVPKFVPAIVTIIPTGPEFGFKLAMLGASAGAGEGAPALAPPVQPCSMAATTNKKDSVIRRSRNAVLVPNVML
jgi:hypothetical protein